MFYLILFLFLPLFLALILGLVVGWMTFEPRPAKFWTGWVPLAGFATLIALLIAISRLIAGRYGLGLDTALLFFSIYIAGCFLGCWLRYFLFGEMNLATATPSLAAAPVSLAAAPQTALRDLDATLASPANSQPAAAPRVEGEDLHGGTRPMGLASPRGGRADDLKLIRGIGKQNEGRLHALGIWHFEQIAGWTNDNVEWVGSYLAFPGRIEREDWLDQARQLAAGVTTDFAARVQRGAVATSKDDGTLGQANVAALGDDGYEGRRPQNTLSAARDGRPDDLKLINGVGRALEQRLNGFGIWHFDQIAAMSDDELRFISHWLGFPGRALRENWRDDCKVLAAGGETEHSRAVKAGKIPTSSSDK